jgi:hypothetical protein
MPCSRLHRRSQASRVAPFEPPCDSAHVSLRHRGRPGTPRAAVGAERRAGRSAMGARTLRMNKKKKKKGQWKQQNQSWPKKKKKKKKKDEKKKIVSSQKKEKKIEN